MRVFARLAVLGLLVISCRDNIVGPTVAPEIYEPYVCTPTTVDTTFFVYDDSMRVIVGATASVGVDWHSWDSCSWLELPASDLVWTVRDTSVVKDTVPDWSTGVQRFLVPRGAGETVVVIDSPKGIDSIFVTVPDTVAMGTVIAVGAGPDVSCAVTDDGTTWCWGGVYSNIMGDFESPDLGHCLGSRCSPMPVPRASGAESVFVGQTHACILDSSGVASCWGSNYSFQLGNMVEGPSHTPVAVDGGHTFASLSLGYAHACGVATDGAGYCWGDATSGKLGGDLHDVYSVATPVEVDATLTWLSIAVHDGTSCGVSDENHLYCWGILGPGNASGPSGSVRCQYFTGKDGTTSSSPCSYTPLRVPLTDPLGADTLFIDVSGPCALTTAGSVYCFDFGSGTYRSMSGVGPFGKVTSLQQHSCALKAGGVAACWGSNWNGQLGDGTTVSRSLPVNVSGGQIWDQVVVGSEHTCGLTMGEVWCWGSTYSGEAGTTLLAPALTPTKVHGQD